MTEIEEDSLLLEPNPEVMIIQEGDIEGQIILHTKVKVDNQDSEVNIDPLPEDPEVHQGLLAEIMTDALIVGFFHYFA